MSATPRLVKLVYTFFHFCFSEFVFITVYSLFLFYIVCNKIRQS